LVFKVPHKKAAARNSRYISPATQSVTINIVGTGLETKVSLDCFLGFLGFVCLQLDAKRHFIW
jgi:hypothetical protein